MSEEDWGIIKLNETEELPMYLLRVRPESHGADMLTVLIRDTKSNFTILE